MRELLNTYSGWISVISLIIAFPLGVLGNLATPKLQKWLSTRSKHSVRGRIRFLEDLIVQVGILKTNPSLAIAKFINIEHRAMMQKFIQYQLITLGFLAMLLINQDSSTSFSEPIDFSNTAQLIFAIVFGLFLGASFAGFFSSKTNELYSMTYRLEEYNDWTARTTLEILSLQERLANMERSDKSN